MKLPVYFRQSWQIMLKDRQYSLIYIVGVALSMALVSSVLIFMVMMLGNVYPENHRGRTMLLTGVHYNDADDKFFGSTSVPDDLVRLIREAEPEGLEAMSVIRPPSICADVLVSSGERAAFYANVRYVDGGFWDVFDFDFLAGRPFGQDTQDGQGGKAGPAAVVSATMAQRCFGDEDAVGRMLTVNGRAVTVCGIVRDVSLAAGIADAEIWLTRDMEERRRILTDWAMPEGGNYIIFLAQSRRHFSDIREAVEKAVGNYNAVQPEDSEFSMSYETEPLSFRVSWLGGVPGLVLSLVIGTIVVILLIPAVNLCGMVSSSLQERLTEFGARKSYGAPFRAMFSQIFAENLMLTLIGGVLGFGLSIGVLNMLSGYFLEVSAVMGDFSNDADLLFPTESFFRPGLFLMGFAAVALLTVFASVQPVMKVLRKGAVELLRDNSYYRTRRVRNVWLVTEAALVFIIGWLLADPMLLNGVRRHAVPAGWDPDRVVCVPVSSLSASAAAYSPEASEDEVLLEDFLRMGRVLAALDGVEALTPASLFFPGNDSETRMTVYADTAVKIQAACFLKELGSDFMDVFGFRVLAPEGGVRPADEGTGTVIISEDLAEALFPGSDPVGQTLYLANNSSPAAPRTVAGVIQRQKVRTMTDNPRPVVIVNMASYPVGYIRSGQCFWVLRLSQDTDMRQFIEQINYGTASRTSFGNLRVGLSYPVAEVMDSYGGRELETILLSYLLLNLILGAFSHYALQTRRRADEFGVRTAMGSTPGRLRRDVVAAGLGQAALSVGIGLFVVLNIILFRGRDVVFIGQVNMPALPESSLAPWPILTSPFLSALMVTLVVAAVIFVVNALAALVSVWKVSGMRPSEILREE